VAVKQEVAVYVVLDEYYAMRFEHLDELLAHFLRHTDAQRIAQRCGEHAGLHRVSFQGLAQCTECYAFLRAGLDFDSEHAETVDKLEEAMVSRRFDGNNIAFAGHCLQCKQQGFLAAVSDTNVVRIDFSADGIQVPVGNLAPQPLFTQGRRVCKASFLGTRHDPFHCSLQRFCSGLHHAGICDTERHHTGCIETIVNAVHQAAPNDRDGLG